MQKTNGHTTVRLPAAKPIASAPQHDRNAVIRRCKARLSQERKDLRIAGRDRRLPVPTIPRVDFVPRSFGAEVDKRAIKGRQMDVPPHFLAVLLRNLRKAKKCAIADKIIDAGLARRPVDHGHVTTDHERHIPPGGNVQLERPRAKHTDHSRIHKVNAFVNHISGSLVCISCTWAV